MLRTLTGEDVDKIRRLWVLGVSETNLGKRFGVSNNTINRVVNRVGAYADKPTAQVYGMDGAGYMDDSDWDAYHKAIC